MNETRTLARFVAETGFTDLPGRLVENLKITVLDTFGAALVGTRQPWAQRIVAVGRALGGAPEASVIHQGWRTDVARAAFANGVLIGAFECEALTGSHASGTVLPAALAVCEHERLSGVAFLTALAVGFGVSARIARTAVGLETVRGFHNPGTQGPFGAAAAAGKLYRFDAERLTDALGIAGSSSAGLLEWGRHQTAASRPRRPARARERAPGPSGRARPGDGPRGSLRLLQRVLDSAQAGGARGRPGNCVGHRAAVAQVVRDPRHPAGGRPGHPGSQARAPARSPSDHARRDHWRAANHGGAARGARARRRAGRPVQPTLHDGGGADPRHVQSAGLRLRGRRRPDRARPGAPYRAGCRGNRPRHAWLLAGGGRHRVRRPASHRAHAPPQGLTGRSVHVAGGRREISALRGVDPRRAADREDRRSGRRTRANIRPERPGPNPGARPPRELEDRVEIGERFGEPGDGQRRAAARQAAQGREAAPEVLGRAHVGARDRDDEADAAGDGRHTREEQPGVVALGVEPERVGAGRVHRSSVRQVVPGVLELPGQPHTDLQHGDGGRYAPTYICAPKTTTMRRASPPTRVRTAASMAGTRRWVDKWSASGTRVPISTATQRATHRGARNREPAAPRLTKKTTRSASSRMMK